MLDQTTIDALNALKIGETLTLPDGRVVVCRSGDCTGCMFTSVVCDVISCSASRREDKKTVHFYSIPARNLYAKLTQVTAAAGAAHKTLAEIDFHNDDPAYTLASIGRAYQLLDRALEEPSDKSDESASGVMGGCGHSSGEVLFSALVVGACFAACAIGILAGSIIA